MKKQPKVIDVLHPNEDIKTSTLKAFWGEIFTKKEIKDFREESFNRYFDSNFKPSGIHGKKL